MGQKEWVQNKNNACTVFTTSQVEQHLKHIASSADRRHPNPVLRIVSYINKICCWWWWDGDADGGAKRHVVMIAVLMTASSSSSHTLQFCTSHICSTLYRTLRHVTQKGLALMSGV